MSRRLLGVVALGLVAALSGCGGDDGQPSPRRTTSGPSGQAVTTTAPGPAPSFEEPKAAAAGGRVGAGPDCQFPARFDTPSRWKAVDRSGAGTVVGGTIRLVCEIDGAPAGVAGTMRVWTRIDPAGVEPQTLARAFARAAEPKAADVQVRQATIGGVAGAEVQYRAATPGRAFVAVLPEFVVIVSWSGSTDAAHRSGLPAYILARSTIKPPDGA